VRVIKLTGYNHYFPFFNELRFVAKRPLLEKDGNENPRCNPVLPAGVPVFMISTDIELATEAKISYDFPALNEIEITSLIYYLAVNIPRFNMIIKYRFI
jgi:hypothetical protein